MNISTQSLHSTLASLVGAGVRPAADTDSVAGVRPQVVVEPANEEEVAAVLAFANTEGLHVLVRGGGTQLALGFPPTGGDILLSTARLNGIVEHVPHDLVVTAQAGLRLTELQATLAKSKQWLALDPTLPIEATIGGIVATNATGPRRLRYGGVRDQIIGVRVVLADGTIAKGGGKVVKNVAGYDLPKLFTGALGTLGVIVAATFRLYPLPVTSRTVQIITSTLAPLGDLAVRILGSTLVPTVIDIQGDTTHRTYTLKANLLPTDVTHWLTHVERLCEQQHICATWYAHAGHGLVTVRLAGDDTALLSATSTLRHIAGEQQGSVVVTEAPLGLDLDVWGPVPALAVMRNLKMRFDPKNTLNPGRFVGGL